MNSDHPLASPVREALGRRDRAAVFLFRPSPRRKADPHFVAEICALAAGYASERERSARETLAAVVSERAQARDVAHIRAREASELGAKLHVALTDLEAAKRQIAERATERLQLVAERDNARADAAELARQVKDRTDERDEAMARSSNAGGELIEVTAERDRLREHADSLAHYLDDCAETLTATSDENTQLRKQLAARPDLASVAGYRVGDQLYPPSAVEVITHDTTGVAVSREEAPAPARKPQARKTGDAK